MRLLGLILLAVSAGCAGTITASSAPEPPRCPPPWSACTRYVTEGFAPRELAAVERAMALWESATDGRLCYLAGAPGEGLTIHRVGKREEIPRRPQANTIALYSSGEIWLAVDETISDEKMAVAAVHELGHAAGLDHQQTGCMRAELDWWCLSSGAIAASDVEVWRGVSGCR